MEDCPICLEPLEKRRYTFACKHVFCKRCICKIQKHDEKNDEKYYSIYQPTVAPFPIPFSHKGYGTLSCPVCHMQTLTAKTKLFIKVVLVFADNLTYNIIRPKDIAALHCSPDLFEYLLTRFLFAIEKHRTMYIKVCEQPDPSIVFVPQLTPDLKQNPAYEKIPAMLGDEFVETVSRQR